MFHLEPRPISLEDIFLQDSFLVLVKFRENMDVVDLLVDNWNLLINNQHTYIIV